MNFSMVMYFNIGLVQNNGHGGFVNADGYGAGCRARCRPKNLQFCYFKVYCIRVMEDAHNTLAREMAGQWQ